MNKYEPETFKDRQCWGAVEEALFAQKKQPSELGCNVLKLLALNPADARGSRFELTEETLIRLKIEFLRSGRDVTEIANAILAVSIFDPLSCIRWLKCLAQGIDIGAKEEEEVKDAILKSTALRNYGSGDFYPGFIMGIWQVAQWLYIDIEHPGTDYERTCNNNKQKIRPCFKKYFPALVRDTICCEHGVAEWANRIFCQGQYDSSLSATGQKFEGQISSLLRGFVKDDKEGELTRQRLIEACILALPDDPENKNIIYWPGEILLNQLLYTAFKGLGLNNRHLALHSFLSKQMAE